MIKKIDIDISIGEVIRGFRSNVSRTVDNLPADTITEAQKQSLNNIPVRDDLVSRSVTEAWSSVKMACQRYIVTGRNYDNNLLEDIVVKEETDSDGHIGVVEYVVLPLHLEIENFNEAVTDHLKNVIHRYMVDYITSAWLKDTLPEKSAEYGTAAGEERDTIIKDINSRTRFKRRPMSWI